MPPIDATKPTRRIPPPLLAALARPCAGIRARAQRRHAGDPTTRPILRIETGMHTARVNGVSADAAGHWLASASNDKTARIWDLRSGALVKVIRPPIGDSREGNLGAVAISPGRRDGCLRRLDWIPMGWLRRVSIFSTAPQG